MNQLHDIAKRDPMSTRNPVQEEPTIDSLKQHLGGLIRHYVETRSAVIASSVVRHIDLLCAHPGLRGDRSERCAYLRLKTHWRWLAENRRRELQD